MKKLGIDLDGVVAAFSDKFCELANKRFGTAYSPLSQTEWDFKPWFSKAQVDEVWKYDIDCAKDFWLDLRPLENTSSLKRVGQQGRDAELYFITSRTPTRGMSAREQTCWWLRSNFGITYPTVIVVDKASEKASIASALGLSSFIDDKAATVVAMHEAGILSYIKLSPYNCAEKYPEGIVPVENLNEYLKLELS